MVLTYGFRYFWKWGNIRKKVRWNRRLRILCTLLIGISRKFHLHFTLTYAKAGFKNYRNLNNVREAVGSPENWNLMGFCTKKHIPLAKTLYTVDLSNITFKYLRVESPNYLWHFWKHKSFFTTQLLCIFISSNITYFPQN